MEELLQQRVRDADVRAAEILHMELMAERDKVHETIYAANCGKCILVFWGNNQVYAVRWPT